MKKVKTNFNNCYGIKSLNYEFDFNDNNVYAIYAPNGFMKTSFSKSLMDYINGINSKDEIFTSRVTIREVLDENDAPIDREKIFVIEPYNKQFKSQKINSLLVNSHLKDKYDECLEQINTKKEHLFNKIQPLLGRGLDIETFYSRVFIQKEDDFFTAILRIEDEVSNDDFSSLDGLVFKKIFTAKVEDFLAQTDIQKTLKEYTECYNELISTSVFLKKGVFTHNNASKIAKNLKDNGFFDANHSVLLNEPDNEKKITTVDELEQLISDEKDRILNNEDLRSVFNEINKKLDSNVELRAFREYIIVNPVILTELDNIPLFKQKLLMSYCQQCLEEYNDLVNTYKSSKAEIEYIVNTAKDEETIWKNVVEIFNKRFIVPFEVVVENQEDVILKRAIANIKFNYKDHENSQNVDESKLFKVLSNGERRALYLLNIIFEIEARKRDGIETLFIIDDIADSFDYKNKYAIIAYLRNISDEPLFKQIVLTHNFDFYRTISSRLSLPRHCKLQATKTTSEILLNVEKYQNNPFKAWKQKLHSNNQMLIASIPFVRNIAEYSGNDAVFDRLTSLLHIKPDTNSFTMLDLETEFKNVLVDKANLTLARAEENVIDIIHQEANTICDDTSQYIELECKIVLAIAIRLKCEEFLISKINDSSFVNTITSNQTFKLSKKYKDMFPQEVDNIELIDQVNLMTPENIHINSFMYEPLLDMSNISLKNLYNNLCQLLLD